VYVAGIGEMRNVSKIYLMKLTRRIRKEGKDVSETGSINCRLNSQRSTYDSGLKCYETIMNPKSDSLKGCKFHDQVGSAFQGRRHYSLLV
jgi:hypothetical protein